MESEQRVVKVAFEGEHRVVKGSCMDPNTRGLFSVQGGRKLNVILHRGSLRSMGVQTEGLSYSISSLRTAADETEE